MLIRRATAAAASHQPLAPTSAAAPPPGAPPDAFARTPGALEALPGGLDDVPMLQSNHPEILHGPGIAVSTLAGPAGLQHDFTGPFEVFCHHQNRSAGPLYQTLVLHNPGRTPVRVDVGPSASFCTDEAPYRDGAARAQEDPDGRLVSGPGDAVSAALLRGGRAVAEGQLTLAPGETRLLHTRVVPARNEATSEFRLDAEGPVQAAVVFTDQPATRQNVAATLAAGKRVAPNPDDQQPTPPDAPGRRVYGRVAGVQASSAWRGRLPAIAADQPGSRSWIVNSLVGHDHGTGQVQSAALLRRYPDAAYAAHGNYGVLYDLGVPLTNDGPTARTVSLYLDAPGEAPPPAQQGLLGSLLGLFFAQAGPSRAYRGEVAIDVDGEPTRYVHVSQTMGQRAAEPLASVSLPPGQAREVRLRLYYPADATAPQALRVETGP